MMQHMFGGPAFAITGHPVGGPTGTAARLFAALAAPMSLPPAAQSAAALAALMGLPPAVQSAAARPMPDDVTDEADLDPPPPSAETVSAQRAPPSDADGMVEADDANNAEDEDDEDDDGGVGRTAIAPEDIAAMVNDIAAQTGVNPVTLFGNFLRQDAEVIDGGGGEADEADDAENAAGDDSDVPDLEIGSHGQITGGVQTMGDVSRLLGTLFDQMHRGATAPHRSAAASPLDGSDDDEPSP